MHEQSFPEMPRPVRGICLLAASAASLGILGGLVRAWHLQADPIWLAATPQVLAEVAVCEQARDRSTRTQCKQALVLARAQAPQATVLASR